MSRMLLLDKQTTDTAGSQDVFKYSQMNGASKSWLYAYGTWDGARAVVEIRRNNGPWIEVADSAFVGDGVYILNGGSYDIRGALSSAGASTSVTLEVVY